MEKNREIKVVVDYEEENFRVEVMGESIVEETVEAVLQRVEEYLRQVA
jgi:aspartate aminotransferase-like enzyme